MKIANAPESRSTSNVFSPNCREFSGRSASWPPGEPVEADGFAFVKYDASVAFGSRVKCEINVANVTSALHFVESLGLLSVAVLEFIQPVRIAHPARQILNLVKDRKRHLIGPIPFCQPACAALCAWTSVPRVPAAPLP
jgi:hypothetical protein